MANQLRSAVRSWKSAIAQVGRSSRGWWKAFPSAPCSGAATDQRPRLPEFLRVRSDLDDGGAPPSAGHESPLREARFVLVGLRTEPDSPGLTESRRYLRSRARVLPVERIF